MRWEGISGGHLVQASCGINPTAGDCVCYSTHKIPKVYKPLAWGHRLTRYNAQAGSDIFQDLTSLWAFQKDSLGVSMGCAVSSESTI